MSVAAGASSDARGAAVLLASSSPRRRALLAQLGVEFIAASPDVDETSLPGESPTEYVGRVAAAKAMAVSAEADQLVIAADTTVDVDGQVLAKPTDLDDARRMLGILSGRDHLVHTAVAVRRGATRRVVTCTTVVSFAELGASTIEWYLAHEDVLDKAGAYAIQGAGGALVERIDGSVSNVVGLPLAELLAVAAELGAPLIP